MSPGHGAVERKFWNTPEIREKHYPYLDIRSTWRSVTSPLDSLIWNRLVKRTIPADAYVQYWWPSDDDVHLASERPKVKGLAHILSLIQDSAEDQPEMELIHAVVARYPVDPATERDQTWWPAPIVLVRGEVFLSLMVFIVWLKNSTLTG